MERLWSQLKALFRNARYMTLAHHYDALNLGFELMVFAKQNNIVDYLVNRWSHLKKKLGASMFRKEGYPHRFKLFQSIFYFYLAEPIATPFSGKLCVWFPL
jgi:hypothetical protein